MGKLTIGVSSSLVGSMSLDFAVKLAEAAIDKGHEVDFWVSGNATLLSKKTQRPFRDYSHLGKKVGELIGRGLEAAACESCCEARGLQKEDTMEGWKRYGMEWYLASCFSADRILYIGDE
ncbi:MAG: DsrE family protein [Nitrospirota bacterium]